MNKILRTLKKIINNPSRVFIYLNERGLLNSVSDKEWVELMWKAHTGKRIDLNNPRTFNEKLQWLKLYDRKPEYTVMADKILAKEYVAEKIGKEYIIPTVAIWNNSNEIDFDKLPEKFVLKCNHNSGMGLYICKDKSNLDIAKIKSNLTKGLAEDYYKLFREWPYKNIPHKILAEKYMEDHEGAELIDYKFFCFESEPKFLYVARANIINNTKNDLLTYYDLNWNIAEFQRDDHERLIEKIDKPANFDKMIELSKILSKGTHFLRVDWYEIDGKLYFGEMTFFPGGGFGFFSPDKWEYKFGEWIDINRKSK